MAWYRDPERSPVRDRLLDSAAELIADRGFRRLHMTEIATVAGVSRQTVYNEFGSKEGLGQQLFTRELDRIALGILAQLDANRGRLRAATEAGVGFILREADVNPLLRAVLTADRDEENGLLAYLTTRSGAAFDTVSELLTGYTEEVWPDVDPLSRSLAVEAVVRLTASHLLQSSADPEQSGRAEAVRRIAEIVMRVSGVVDPEPEPTDAEPTGPEPPAPAGI
ncbi:TetR family transcriptional regulator [Kitasatospora viridis]|uniref:TetR family transcriptional regulator n=1 Tax=Kitasatospora viridis TaxID=281105 RepID=A0A561S9Z5_9ACTN|nr:TetR family transcriptional regulator [Kitasatospora viridis]TWF71624.1 TetR family transcriptional regulator [Kitasatospora viridis]